MNGLNRFVVGCECNRATLDSLRANGYAGRIGLEYLPSGATVDGLMFLG